jgi:ribosomal protein S18 acetylase RimI-like enzyme
VSLAFRRLVDSDEPVVCDWLEAYLVEHAAWWLDARGIASDPTQLVHDRGLVDRDWDELLIARAADFVQVAELDGRPAGIVRAALREDRHLGFTEGVLQWIAVAPEARGQGVATALVQLVTQWFDAHGVSGELFVTAANTTAVRAYERAGFRPVDTRMLRPRSGE